MQGVQEIHGFVAIHMVSHLVNTFPYNVENDMKLPAADQMQALDLSATEHFGIPSIVLMENAGLGTVRMMESELGPCADKFCLIFVGPGNNGGDGLVIGRHLHQRGCQVLFVFLIDPSTLQNDPQVNFKIVQKLNLPSLIVDSEQAVDSIEAFINAHISRDVSGYAIVDSIFGIGLSRKVEGRFAAAIEAVNSKIYGRKVPVVSVDIPSGMDANTGKQWGCCIKADFTATYGWAKPGHFINGRPSRVGKLAILDIGIPPQATTMAEISTELCTAENLLPRLQVLQRKGIGHKGSYGHLMMLAGSAGKTGAAILAARGAMRSGAGLVSLAVPHDLNPVFETALIEAMTISLPASRQKLSVDDWDTIVEIASTMQAVVIGPGIGTAVETAELVLQAYHTLPCPLVIDADALNILAISSDIVGQAAGPRIFTPHPGELSRLLAISTADIQNNRIEAAREGRSLFSNSLHESVLVLKGAGTIIAQNDGSILINSSGNPGMGTGGMGDVLSGVIGSFICQGMNIGDAASAGVYVHGAAADMLFDEYGAGFSATEVADTIPTALKNIMDRR